MGLKERVQKKTEVKKYNPETESLQGKEIKAYLQSYLFWLKVQNNQFASNLTTEELTNYFLGALVLPIEIEKYMEENPLQTLSKVYEYIDRYKKNTEMFSLCREIIPKHKANYKEV